MQALNPLLQLLIVVQVIVQHIVHLIPELRLIVVLLLNLLNRVLHFLLHALALESHISDDQSQVLIDNVEMLRLCVHLSLLLLQSLDNLHPRSNPALQLLDLVIQHKLELFELHGSFTILINLELLVLNRLVSLLQLIFHTLNMRLLKFCLRNLSIQVGILLLDLLLQVVSFLLIVAILIANQSQFTSLLHTLINLHCQLGLVFLLDGLDVLPGLILDLLTVLLVIFDHLLDLVRQCLLFGLELLELEVLVSAQLVHEALVGQVGLTH